jgi:hypothetical protein
MDPDDGEYEYKGLPLTPAIVGELATILFAGRTVRRNEIVAATAEYHVDHGGAPSQASTISQTKKALSVLQKAGRVEKTPGYGLWRFPESDLVDVPPGEATGELDTEDQDPPYPIEVESEVGQGPQVVYVYSYPAYHRLAELEGRDSWPVKIGRSASAPHERVKDQVGTGNPEWPVVHLVIRTTAATDLERFLHSALRLEGRQLEGPGAEWFDASPNWVTSMLQRALPGILNDAADSP